MAQTGIPAVYMRGGTSKGLFFQGSVVSAVARLDGRDPEQEVRIGHPAGILPIGARVIRRGNRWVCEKAVTFRTARRLMDGCVCVPASVASPVPADARAP